MDESVENRVLSKYLGGERDRISYVYHEAAKEMVKPALKTDSAIALEDIEENRGKENYLRELDGRLHKWSFRKLQPTIKYKAKLSRTIVSYVNPHKTSGWKYNR